MKNVFKDTKGITLIALIITIIVLLILAVVTISAVNEGSIFAHANNAATKYNEKATEENTIVTGYLEEMAKHDGEPTNPEEPDVNSYGFYEGVVYAGTVYGTPYYYQFGSVDLEHDQCIGYAKFIQNENTTEAPAETIDIGTDIVRDFADEDNKVMNGTYLIKHSSGTPVFRINSDKTLTAIVVVPSGGKYQSVTDLGTFTANFNLDWDSI